MKKVLSITIASILLTGCAYDNVVPVDVRPAANCTTKLQCEAMWLAAKQSLQSLTGYRLQTISDDYIETYANSRSSNFIAGRASKKPNPDGSYTIQPQFICLNMFGCFGNEYRMMDQFNANVTAAGAHFKTNKTPPEPEETPIFKSLNL